MTDYLKSKAIGSSLAADCVVSLEPLEICTDRATRERKPTTFMEMGKIFEDLVEATYARGLDWFWEKYFKSDMDSIPNYKGERKDIKQILEILDECMDNQEFYLLFDSAYIYNAKPDKDGNRVLSKTYKSRHRMLDQIAAHDYRRPIPKAWWSKLEIMLERFKNRPFEIAGIEKPMSEWMNKKYVDVSFQVEHFWETWDYSMERKAHCRAKFDMVWAWEVGGVKYAIPWDIKCTGDEIEGRKSFGAFVGNWKKAYVLQSIHYREAFEDWCRVNGFEPFDDLIYYVIQESDDPQVCHVWFLHRYELETLKQPYRQALPVIQKWIDDGRPIKGYTPQKAVNRYGGEWREL